MQKRSEPSVEGFHIFKTYCVDSLARSYCGLMQQFDTFFPSPALSSLYILPEMIIRIKKYKVTV